MAWHQNFRRTASYFMSTILRMPSSIYSLKGSLSFVTWRWGRRRRNSSEHSSSCSRYILLACVDVGGGAGAGGSSPSITSSHFYYWVPRVLYELSVEPTPGLWGRDLVSQRKLPAHSCKHGFDTMVLSWECPPISPTPQNVYSKLHLWFKTQARKTEWVRTVAFVISNSCSELPAQMLTITPASVSSAHLTDTSAFPHPQPSFSPDSPAALHCLVCI